MRHWRGGGIDEEEASIRRSIDEKEAFKRRRQWRRRVIDEKEASMRRHQWGHIKEEASMKRHQWGGMINKKTFHTGTLQWPPLYCGSLASKTPCEMRWCLWNMRRSLLLGGSIEWLWLLSRQILLLMHQWCSVLWPTPMRPDGFYSHCMYSCMYQRTLGIK